jgi:hypothetical protein
MAKTGVTQAKGAGGYWREAEAQAVVAAWRESGETLTTFARQRGVPPRRLARWARRLGGAKRGAAVRFHPVRLVAPAAREARIEIVLGGGVEVRVPSGFAVEDLRRVLAVVGEGR